MRAYLIHGLILSTLSLSFAACSKNEEAAPPAASPAAAAAASSAQEAASGTATVVPATTTPPAAPTPPPIPPRTGTKIDDVMDSYEVVRVALAGDDFPGARSAAEKLVGAAAAAVEPGTSVEAHVKAIQAGALKVQQAADMPAARLAFGEVSRATVSIVVARPELQTGRFLMMCPMAQGYQKWVQTDAALRNPYFGSQMLECGEQLKAWSA